MEDVDITELSQRTGLAPSALRFYERRGLLAPTGRRGGKRVYGAEAVHQIALIDLLKISGFTLTEIAGLVDRDGRVSADWRTQASHKHKQLRQQRNDLERALTMLQHTINCPSDSLHHCPTHRAVVAAHAKTLAASR